VPALVPVLALIQELEQVLAQVQTHRLHPLA
jgi:hypothetical protein